MPRILTDEEIDSLIVEEKVLPENWGARLQLRLKKRMPFDERQFDIESSAGHKFTYIARRNSQNHLDFSIILRFQDEDGNEFRLTRYNGKTARHTNRWEKYNGVDGHTFGPAFHIHRATERYQQDGFACDGFAEATDAYSDFDSARDAFLDGCGFVQPRRPPGPQQRLFE